MFLDKTDPSSSSILSNAPATTSGTSAKAKLSLNELRGINSPALRALVGNPCQLVDGWEPVMQNETYAFLGVIVAMSLHKVPAINDYWSLDWVLGVPAIALIFPRHQIWQLWRNLHLTDNAKMSARGSHNFDKPYKLRPLLDVLQRTFMEIYHPGQEITVDESMVHFKGRSLKQYEPKKTIKRGIMSMLWVPTAIPNLRWSHRY